MRMQLAVQVTISLLEKAMSESGKDSFLIDGFPRNEENRSAFEQQVGPVALTSCACRAVQAARAQQAHGCQYVYGTNLT